MQLLAVSFYEFRQFLQLLMWIAIPLTVVTLTITVIVHYWRKKRKQENEMIYPDQEQASIVHPRTGETEEPAQGYQGVLWLRTKYQQDLKQAEDKTAELQEALHTLQDKYDALNKVSSDNTPVTDELTLDNLQRLKAIEAEKIAMLEATVSRLQLELASAEKTEADMPVNPAVAENSTAPQQPLAENDLLTQETLQDLINEKNTQVHFLQTQLDQRIREFHEVEFQGRNDASRADQLHQELEQKLHENRQQQEAIGLKADYIERLEQEIQSQQQQYAQLETNLHDRLSREERNARELEEKLANSLSILQQIQLALHASSGMNIAGKNGRGSETVEGKAKISAWIESPSEEEEFEQAI